MTNYRIEIIKIDLVNEIDGYWSSEDYVALLNLFNFPDGAGTDPASLPELLEMAIADYEPQEAAAIVLTYKFGELLNEGQIDQIAHNMLIDKVCEEYPDIGLQGTLFNINQLLYKGYNGKFPNAKATVLQFSAKKEGGNDAQLSEGEILKLLAQGLSNRNLIKRLFEEQLVSQAPFAEAANIIWKLISKDTENYILITSENWLNKEDLQSNEFEAFLEEIEE